MPFRILSIDGGGLRGIIPLKILEEIEYRTGKPIAESFDLIAGTSTGGIIACGLAMSEANNKDKARYTAANLIDFYIQNGATIFPNRNWLSRPYYAVRNYFRPRFSNKGLDTVLSEFFEEAKLTDCITPVLISAYCVQNYTPVFFTSRFIYPSSNGYDINKNIALTNFCKATSAAPTYLPSFYFPFYNEYNVPMPFNCIDGGVYVNNPSLVAVAEVLNNSSDIIYTQATPKKKPVDISDIYLLSLGTGNTSNSITREQGKKWGIAKWGRPVINLMMQGNSQIVDSQVKQILKDRYLRLDITIEKEYSDMADSSADTRKYLIEEVNKSILTQTGKFQLIQDFIDAAKL